MELQDPFGGHLGDILGNEVVSIGTGLVRDVLPQTSLMMALGLFVFALKTLPYQQLQRQTSWRHPSNSRIGKRPTRQYLGPGDDDITLTGTLYPELTGGRVSLAMIRTMASTGKSWPLIRGDGNVYGVFVIENVDETGSIFFPDGEPRKIDFSLKLTRVDDEDIDMLGSVTSQLQAML
ncbi:MAG: phage tail protein [Georgfuchsia sp.]